MDTPSPPPTLAHRDRRRRRPRQRGYSLIFLVMIFTTLSILAAAALPAIEQMIRRNKEEELIFRGFQYAEAIRVFQRRFGRYPIRLQELVEVKPRCIRQLWKDPMTDSGTWGIVSVNAPRRRGQQPPPNADGSKQNPPQVENDPDGGVDEPGPGEAPPPGENLPILGVYSLSDKESIKTLFGKSAYKEWRFTTDVLRAPFGVGPGGSVPRVANATWIGRPFRQGLAQPAGGKGPGGMPPGMPGVPPESGPIKPPAPGGPIAKPPDKGNG